jgi:DNA-binding NarL/FixJ family response regulator
MDSTQKTKIILIDDHEIVRLGLSHVINAENDLAVVAQSNDAQSGLIEIMKHRPDVAVVDINMPGTSVFEMVQVALKQLPGLKVIYLTAYNTDTNVERALASGASGFVTKGESLGTIVAAIREVIGGRTPFLSDDVRGRVVTNNRIAPMTGNASEAGVHALTITARKNLLSPREIEVLCCVAQGQSAKQIATVLSISSKTVERHKSNIMAKLSLHTQVDLTRYAIREGIISA